MADEIKIDKEQIINHNKHILAVSGGNFGVIDLSNLEFAVDSVNYEVDTIQKATNFLYYMGAGHTFENGNKRIAFEGAKGIMASGGRVVTANSGEVINFVTGSVAQGKATKEDVKEWLILNSKPVNEKPEFNEVTSKNIEKDKELLKKLD